MRDFIYLHVLFCSILLVSCESNSGKKQPPVEEIKETIIEPIAINSKNGVLETTLTAEPAQITVAGQTFMSNVYNGSYLPPVLRLHQGDSIKLKLVNKIKKAFLIERPQSTNLHYHGFSVPPKLPGDYVYLCIKPEIGADLPEEFRLKPEDMCGYPVVPNEYNYRMKIPDNHPKGVHWFHPHSHGLTMQQVMSGMSGMVVIEGLIEDHYPELSGMRERLFMLKDIRLPGSPDTIALTKTLNGQTDATIAMRPGEWQLWRIGHIGANAFYKFHLEGHSFWILSQDGNILEKPKQMDTLFMPPASRYSVVVRATEKAGNYTLHSLETNTGPQGDPNPKVQLGTVIVGGTPLPQKDDEDILQRLQKTAANIRQLHPVVEDVEKLPITRERVITYTESADGKTFFIDGKEFDLNRIDIQVKLGDVEKWTIRNRTQELHTFHIHQLDYLVTKIKGQTMDSEGMRDVIDIPYMENGVPGEVELIIPFTNPDIVGKFVYHCHIMEHEDNGMMANIEVVK